MVSDFNFLSIEFSKMNKEKTQKSPVSNDYQIRE